MPGHLSLVALWTQVLKPYQNGNIDWDEGRDGYVATPNYARPQNTAKKASSQGGLLSIRSEERLGSLITAAGMIWGTYAATVDFDALWRMRVLPPGPVEVCMLGILTWLHGKWRRSMKVD